MMGDALVFGTGSQHEMGMKLKMKMKVEDVLRCVGNVGRNLGCALIVMEGVVVEEGAVLEGRKERKDCRCPSGLTNFDLSAPHKVRQ